MDDEIKKKKAETNLREDAAVVAFEAGPLGLKLRKEKQSGFVLITEASGQAAQKGLGSGDRLMKVEEEFLPIGIDQHSAAQKIIAYPRPVKLSFQKEGGLGGGSMAAGPKPHLAAPAPAAAALAPAPAIAAGAPVEGVDKKEAVWTRRKKV
jgi:hypothetical protein